MHNKVAFLGNAQVGKSKILSRLIREKNFVLESYAETTGANYLTLSDDDGNKLSLWDVGGAERFKSLHPMYYRGASVCCVMWDPLSESPLSYIEEYTHVFIEENPKMSIIFVRCKADIPVEENILKNQIQRINNLMGGQAIILSTSAKTEEGIDALKSKIFECALNKHKSYQAPFEFAPAEKENPSNKKSRCCCRLFTRRKQSPDAIELLQNPDPKDPGNIL